MPGYQQTSRDGSDPRPPPPYDNIDPWVLPAEDRDPLLGGHNRMYGTADQQGGQYTRGQRLGKARQLGLKLVCCIAIVSLLFSCGFGGYILNDPLNQKEHDVIRRQWAEEKQNWTVTRKEWEVEEQRHQAQRAAEKHRWKLARQEWVVEEQEHQAQRAEEERKHQAQRAEEDRKHQAKRVEEDRRHRAQLAEEDRKHQAKRAVEEQEHQAQRAEMEEERTEWEREKRVIEQDRAKWGRERQEKETKERRDQKEDTKKRAAIVWAGLEAGHCLRYKLKEYTASLSNVALGVDSIQACWNKSVEIHGKEWFPTRCEDQGLCGRVTGHWEVDIDEPSCTPRWDYPVDKGCAESGYRRFEAQLLDFPDTTDWPVICRTAPTQINGTWYDGPTSCERGWWGNIWGKWLIDDNTCG